ncbi:hypothetical protein D9C73_011497 [Collichthys lucidus]|uniref:Uncharacterized protein n=1 Tax=Collichthys lucidus TaxID=240159 RepID=A0A4U5UQR7_COLLU|nr:hypothetical protein D9C73_011497 [Collichthys lucidus]
MQDLNIRPSLTKPKAKLEGTARIWWRTFVLLFKVDKGVQLNQGIRGGRGLREVSAHNVNASLSLSPKPRVGKGRSIQLQPSTSDDLQALLRGL